MHRDEEDKVPEGDDEPMRDETDENGDDDDEEGGWDEWEEEDEVDPVVAEALA